MKTTDTGKGQDSESASELISNRITQLGDWRGQTLGRPAHLFNSSLDGHVRRAIDIQEGGQIDESALTALIREAVALNVSAKKAPRKRAAR